MPRETDLYEDFLEWLYEKQMERDDDDPVTVYDMLSLVKALVPQLRMSLLPTEVPLAFVHAAAFMERWMQENNYTMREIGTDKVTRIHLAEEHRLGQNPLADVDEGWVPDELPDWLFGDDLEG